MQQCVKSQNFFPLENNPLYGTELTETFLYFIFQLFSNISPSYYSQKC